MNFVSMTSKIFLLISFNTYSIARSIMFSTSVMELLEIGCQFSWPLGPTTWRHSGNDTGKCTHTYRRPVLEKLTCPLFCWFLSGFPSILTEVWILNMEKRQAQDQRNWQKNADTERHWDILPGPLLLVFLWFSLISPGFVFSVLWLRLG